MPVLLAILVGCGAAMLLVAALRRRNAGGRPSIDRYHRAMGVLGELSDRVRPPGTVSGLRDGGPGASGHRGGEGTEEPPVLPLRPLDEPHGFATVGDVRAARPPHIVGATPPRPPKDLPTDRPPGAQPFTPRPGPRRPGPRRLLPALLVAGAVLALGLGLSLSSTPAGPRHHASSAPVVHETSPAPTAGPASVRARPAPRQSPASTTRSVTPSASPSTTSTVTSTTAATAPAGGAPVLASVQPPRAAPGQTVTIVGSGFTSADGVVVATVDGQAAPTRCPSEGRCVVTVPSGTAGTAVVHVRTDTGTSNGLRLSVR